MQKYLENVELHQYLPGVIAWATNILLAIVILIIGIWFANRAYRLVNNLGKKYDNLDDTLFRFFGSLARYAILAFVGIAVLNRFGVQTASVVALLGAAGLAIGLALQGAMSNLAAGVMLLIFRPYKVGDFINAAGQFGNVTEVDMFTTILQTFDKQQIIVPNSKIWGEQIINHSHYDIRGVDMHFGVAYSADLKKTREVIESVLELHPHILKDPKPFIEVETLNNSSVDFLVRPFCKGENYFNILYSVPEKIKLALDEANIEIPFPHRKIFVVNENQE